MPDTEIPKRRPVRTAERSDDADWNALEVMVQLVRSKLTACSDDADWNIWLMLVTWDVFVSVVAETSEAQPVNMELMFTQAVRS